MANEQWDKESFEKFLEENYGVTAEDLRWFSHYHRSVTKYGDWIAKAIVVSTVLSLVSGIIYLITLGIRQALRVLIQ